METMREIVFVLLSSVATMGCTWDDSVCKDNDGDGYGIGKDCLGIDCDDSEAMANPGLDEISYDGLDNDCDEATPDDDLDGDGYLHTNDCDDENALVNPGVAEIPHDGVDNDCDEATLDDDVDGDGYSFDVDCDDTDSTVHPGADEICDDGIDQNCDDVDLSCNCADADGDEYQDATCGGSDCDDNDPWIRPGGIELPNDGVDADCNGNDLTASNEVGVFVARTGNDSNPGTMEEPKLTVAAGVVLAENEGKVVFVAAGEYNESVIAYVSIFGGYEQDGWTRNIDLNETSIVAVEDHAVRVASGVSIALEGLTVRGGSGNFMSYGIALESYSEVLLARNEMYGGSGQLSVGLGSDSINFLGYNKLKTENNLINGGNGSIESYGMRVVHVEAMLVNNIIEGGSGAERSYGISACALELIGICDDNLIELANNVVTSGSADYGESILIFDGTAVILNNILTGSIYVHYGGNTVDITLVNNDIFPQGGICALRTDQCYNDYEVDWCNWRGCTESNNNKFEDPLFQDITAGDYHLTGLSPCVDAGVDPSSYQLSVTNDFEGDPRPQGSRWDIGADEYVP